MATHPNKGYGAKTKERIEKYGLHWLPTIHPAAMELDMIRQGGFYVRASGKISGHGLAFHFKEFIKIVWPDIVHHKWTDLFIDNWVSHRTVVAIGPASSGKSFCAAICHLVDWMAWPDCTTVLCTSTTLEQLDMRVWGEINSLHRRAIANVPWLPGIAIESRRCIVLDERTSAAEGRDFRNGIKCLALYKGQAFQGMSSFVGIKNKRVRLLAEELSLLPRTFLDCLGNLDKNPDFKVTGDGNPKDTIDALGVLGEPAPEIGGWESGIDQVDGSKVWKTRRPDGICIQFDGEDSPNMDGKLGIPLICNEDIQRDIAFYGRDSLNYTMMNRGRMPRGQGARRVLTRQMCLKFHAMDDPVWVNTSQTQVAFLDAAFRSVGGDRCVFGVLEFGEEAPTTPGEIAADAADVFANDRNQRSPRRHIMALKELLIVPIKGGPFDLPEDQIVEYVREQCIARQIPPEHFFFDAAMRTSLVTAFSRLWSNAVNSVDCMGKASEVPVSSEITVPCKDYYFNFITELWYSIRLIVEADQMRGLSEEVILEFSSREWITVSNNKIQVEPKDKMKLKSGRSPDLADALAVGAYGARQLGFRIQRLKPPPGKRSKWDLDQPNWRREILDQAASMRQRGVLDHAA